MRAAAWGDRNGWRGAVSDRPLRLLDTALDPVSAAERLRPGATAYSTPEGHGDKNQDRAGLWANGPASRRAEAGLIRAPSNRPVPSSAVQPPEGRAAAAAALLRRPGDWLYTIHGSIRSTYSVYSN